MVMYRIYENRISLETGRRVGIVKKNSKEVMNA